VTVAVLDTGVAYDNHGRYIRSPDFSASEFIAGYDFVSRSRYAMTATGTGRRSPGRSPSRPTTASASPASPTAYE